MNNEPQWAETEGSDGPNGGRWKVRRRRWPAHVPIRLESGAEVASVNESDEFVLFFVTADGVEYRLWGEVINVPNAPGLAEKIKGRMWQTAMYQRWAPEFRRRPRVGARVIAFFDGAQREGAVDSHCILVNERGGGDDGEDQSRGEFSAFVVDFDSGGRGVYFPEQVREMAA